MPTTKLVEGKDLAIIKSVIQSIDYGRTSTYRSQLEAFEIEAQACGRGREEGKRILYDVFDLNSDPPVYDRTVHVNNYDIRYDAEDFVNPGSFRDHRRNFSKAWMIHVQGTVLAIVFAEYDAYCDQDALDEAADSGKLDGLMVKEEDLKDYETGNFSDDKDAPNGIGWPEYEGIINLGNASEPFDSQSLDIFVVSAELFAEDPALMTPDRVMEYLKEQAEEAHRTYKATPLLDEPGDNKWLEAYRNDDDWQDAVTLAKFAQSR